MLEILKLKTSAEKELDYILTSTTVGHVVNDKHSNEYHSAIEALLKSIIRSVKKSGKDLAGDTPSEKIKSSSHYKLAEICKEAVNVDEFREFINTYLPSYVGNYRMLLGSPTRQGYAGFMWKVKFKLPDKRAYAERKHNGVKIEKPQPKEFPPNVLEMFDNTIKALTATANAQHAEIVLLKTEIAKLKDHMHHPVTGEPVVYKSLKD